MLLHVLLLLLVLYTFFAYLLSKKRSSLPPGPAPWLFFGNVPDFVYAQIQGKNAVQVLIEWKEKYGNVFTIWLGPMPTINVCDYKTAVDAFVKNGDAHVGRFRTHLAFVTRGVYGLLFSEGQCWQEQRRFCLHVLKNFGLGRNLMQERILDEIRFSFERLDKTIEMNRSAVIDPADVFDPLVGSVINKIASGQRFDESNMETFFQIKRDLDQSVTRTSAFDHALLGATSTRFPFFKQRLEYLKTSHLNLRKWLIDNIEERKAKIADGSHLLVESDPCDYIDAYFLEMERRKKSGEPMDSFCIDALVSNLMDFWLAGMETTILTFMWATIYLLKYPEVHEKVYKEIVNCTGGNRYLELCDKLDTPYFNAVITETQRHANVLNFNLWHKTTTKTMVGEYLIPEGVTIAPQLSVIMSNEAAFKNSCKFDPDRYLNSKLGEEVIPFGIGKRSCLGEGLAKAELHLILGNFIQQYRIYVPEGEEAPSTEPATPFGLMHRNKHFTCAIERRATS